MDFLPDAVMKVLDIMKKNDHIGAACGRIHPTGSGMCARVITIMFNFHILA